MLNYSSYANVFQVLADGILVALLVALGFLALFAIGRIF